MSTTDHDKAMSLHCRYCGEEIGGEPFGIWESAGSGSSDERRYCASEDSPDHLHAPAVRAPVIRIPLADVPSQCPNCGVDAAFPLTVFGNQVHASCPACFTIVAQVAVTTPDDARESSSPAVLCKCSARPDGATGIRWTGTNLTQCFTIIDYDECGEEPAPGEIVTDPALTGDADDCACDSHASWREPI